MFRSYPVFNLAQTENVPKKEAGPVLDPDRDLMEVCDSVLDRMPNPPDYTGKAAVEPTTCRKKILVNLPPIATFKTTEGYVATKWHEYGHATGHEARLNRPGIMGAAAFGGEDYSFEELVAELTSAYLCAEEWD